MTGRLPVFLIARLTCCIVSCLTLILQTQDIIIVSLCPGIALSGSVGISRGSRRGVQASRSRICYPACTLRGDERVGRRPYQVLNAVIHIDRRVGVLAKLIV